MGVWIVIIKLEEDILFRPAIRSLLGVIRIIQEFVGNCIICFKLIGRGETERTTTNRGSGYKQVLYHNYTEQYTHTQHEPSKREYKKQPWITTSYQAAVGESQT